MEASWPVPLPDANSMSRLRRKLMAWFRAEARDLPWRRSRDPYAIWVSEIMLQQTQVATVERYFPRFLAAFPDIASLAAADEHDVLRLWEGLGYYRRARQMHRAAGDIVARHGGVFPRDPEKVRDLPGIGRYTAGAILSIAFDAHEPILEANTFRLLARLLAYPDDPTATAGQRLLWHFAEQLLPVRETGLFNQALMELGATVCTPRGPACERCPIAELCPTRGRGLQDRIPLARTKQRVEERHEAAVVVERGGRVLIGRCDDGGRWAGLWDFPRFHLEQAHAKGCPPELLDKLQAATGLAAEPVELLTTLKHGVTRFRITLGCWRARPVGGKLARSSRWKWVRPDELEEYALSTTGRKLARLLVKGMGASEGVEAGLPLTPDPAPTRGEGRKRRTGRASAAE